MDEEINAGKEFLITIAGYGLSIEEVTGDTIYVSVPEFSNHLDANDEPMCGRHLVERFIIALGEIGVKDVGVRHRIRNGETWDDNYKPKYCANMRKILEGSGI